MLSSIAEKLVYISSKIGDFIESPRKCINGMFVYVTMGSIPSRKACDCKIEEEFCKRLQGIKMEGCRRESQTQ